MLARLLSLLAPPCCAACRAPVPGAADPLCATCRRTLPWLREARMRDGAWSPLAHAGPARDLVSALKFHGAWPVARLAAAQIAAGAPRGTFDDAVLVPVPAHPAHQRQRGYDQAVLIARALGRRTGLPVACCLRRRGSVQLGAGRRERLRPGRIAVQVRPPVPARAVLVDDVRTTGATLAACRAALREAGTSHVLAVTWTRA